MTKAAGEVKLISRRGNVIPEPAVYAANVCLYKANAVYLTNITNHEGHCEFIVDGSASGAEITATKYNFVLGQNTVTGG